MRNELITVDRPVMTPEELEADNKIMGHSKEVALETYIKKPQKESEE